LIETSAIIELSDLFIGNDSGLGHISSAVNTKSFTIFGEGQPNRYRPWGKKAFWYQSKDLKIESIDISSIYKRIIKIL